jgi:hypothetical protein
MTATTTIAVSATLTADVRLAGDNPWSFVLVLRDGPNEVWVSEPTSVGRRPDAFPGVLGLLDELGIEVTETPRLAEWLDLDPLDSCWESAGWHLAEWRREHLPSAPSRSL